LASNTDREEETTAVRCPDCQGALGAPTDSYERIVEDIVPYKVGVRRIRVFPYGCSSCLKKVSAPVPDAFRRGKVRVFLFHCAGAQQATTRQLLH
jgi:DNA-directed RNA polymerase subunit RPC12/RpoP